MTRKPFTAKGMAREIRRMKGDTKKAVMRGLRNAARASIAILVQRTPSDTGQLKASWKHTGSRRGRNTHEVYNEAPHAGIVEEGARPHAVSYEGRRALYEWASRKFSGKTEKELNAIVEGIAWKLLHHGQKPTYFVKDALPLLRRVSTEEVVRAVNAAHAKRTT